MTSPVTLSSRAVRRALESIGSLGEAASKAPEFQRDMLALLVALERRIGGLPDAIEGAIRSHFEGQKKAIESLKPELVRNRRAAEELPKRVDALRAEIAQLRHEMEEVREAVEPLQGPAERAARISERLPGAG